MVEKRPFTGAKQALAIVDQPISWAKSSRHFFE